MEIEEKEDLQTERKKTEQWRIKEQRRHLRRQLGLTDRVLAVCEKALKDEHELYRYVQTAKSGGSCETVCEEKPALNEDRLAKIVKALSELIGIQHSILAVPLFKEGADAENTRAKLGSERDIALRKIEIDLMKIDGGEEKSMPEELLAALNGDADDT